MKLKFPITKHIRAELNKAGIVRLRNVRVDEASYSELRQLVEGGGYAHLTDDERHAITVGCCLTHPNHRKKHQFPWLTACILGVAAILLLLFAVSARAQGTSQIDVITFRDNSGVLVKSFAAPFTIKCGLNTSCTASGSVLTFAATGGGGGGGFYQTFQNAGVALTQRDTANFFAGITCVDNPGSTRTDCTLTTVASTAHKFFNAVASGALVAAQPDVADLTASGCADNQILVMSSGLPVCVDPSMWGPDAQGAAQTKGPLLQGGRDYTNNVVKAFAVDPASNAQIINIGNTVAVNLPQQAFLNTQMFSDVTAAGPTRGDLITAQGATPKWARLAVGTASQALFGGTEPAWGTTTLLNAGLLSDTASGTVISGDTVIGNATPKWARLAAPTSTGRAYLTEIPNYQSTPAAPSLTVQNGGGTIAQNTTVFVRIRLKYPNGSSAPSIETSIVTSAANGCTASCTVTVALNASICQPTASGQTATGCDVYDATTSGGEKLQAASADCRNIAANCVIGTVAAGATMETANAATIVQPVQWKQEKVRVACDFTWAGTSAFQQIQAAADDLPIDGGIVDARCYGGGVQFGNDQILTLGSSLKRVTLIVDNATDFEMANSSSSASINICNNSGIIAVGANWESSPNGIPVGGFVATTGFNAPAVITNCDKTGAQQGMFLYGVMVKGGSTATVSTALIDIEGVGDSTTIENCLFYNSGSVILLLKGNASVVPTAQILIKNTWINGGGLTNAIPLQVRGASGGGGVQNVTFVGGSIVNAGNGKNLVDMDGLGNQCSIRNISFVGTYFETTTTGVTTAVNLKDVCGISFYNNSLGGQAVTNFFNIAQSAAGQSHTITWNAVNHTNATNFYTDAVNGSATLVSSYVSRMEWNGLSTMAGSIPASIVADSAGINTTETIIVKTAALAANRLVAGTVIRATLEGTCTTTAANVSTFQIRIGANGTTADTLVFTAATPAAGTTGTNIPFKAIIDLTIRTVGAAATAMGYLELQTQGATGISTVNTVVKGTMTTFNSTTAGDIISVTYKSAATTTTSTFNNGFIDMVYR